MLNNNLRTNATNSPSRYVSLRVGEVHPDWDTLEPQLLVDGAVYNYTVTGHELTCYLERPARDEVRAFRKGRAKFALLEEGPVLFLLHRFGEALPWSDAPYSIHLVPEERRQLPPALLGPHSRALLTAMLVDRSTGVIRGMRALSWSPGFTRVMHAAIRRQATLDFDPDEYDEAIARAYRKWPESSEMLRAVAARTSGGA